MEVDWLNLMAMEMPLTIVNAIKDVATTLKAINEITNACTGNECKELNPNKRCYSKEINQLIKLEAKNV